MDRRGSNTWLVAALAIAVGFLAALLIFGGDNKSTTSTVASSTTATTTGTSTATGASATSTTATSTTPSDAQASVSSCIDLWNQPANRGDQTFLVNVMAQQPVRVHVGVTSDVPPKCLITMVASRGDAYVFPAAGGSTYPYAQAPAATPASTLPAAQKTSNALVQRDGTLSAR